MYLLSIGEDNDGVGYVCLLTHMGMPLLLKGFMHAPYAFFYLIFVYIFDDDGFYNHFFSRTSKFNKGNLIGYNL